MEDIKKRQVVDGIDVDRFLADVEKVRERNHLSQKGMCKVLGISTNGWLKMVKDGTKPVTEIALDNLMKLTNKNRSYYVDATVTVEDGKGWAVIHCSRLGFGFDHWLMSDRKVSAAELEAARDATEFKIDLHPYGVDLWAGIGLILGWEICESKKEAEKRVEAYNKGAKTLSQEVFEEFLRSYDDDDDADQ